MAILVGQTLGRYRLDVSLGKGGMAEVYRAVDEKLGRAVAVKVILPQFASDAQFRERFLREARLVAALEHANILPVYDFGEQGDLPYLVMPYLRGGTLADRLKGQGLPLAVVIDWITQLAGALDTAHRAGVLHRDVKPANVLLGPQGRLVLADFGIAKMAAGATRLTQTGVVVGTPVYMAPELVKGEEASASSDLYALATVAFEMLSGGPPFDGENALSLMHQHVTRPIPSLVGAGVDLPPDLDPILARALAKEPAQRPVSCLTFATALGSLLAPPDDAGSLAEESAATAPTRLSLPTQGGSESLVDPTHDAPSRATGPRRRRWLHALAVLALGILAVVAFQWPLEDAPSGSDPAAEEVRGPLPAESTTGSVLPPKAGEEPTESEGALPTTEPGAEEVLQPGSAEGPAAQRGSLSSSPTDSPGSVLVPQSRPEPALTAAPVENPLSSTDEGSGAPEKEMSPSPPPESNDRSGPSARPSERGERSGPLSNELQLRLLSRIEDTWSRGRPGHEQYRRLFFESTEQLKRSPESALFRFMRTFAKGGIAYTEGRQEEAREQLEVLLREGGRALEILAVLPIRFLRQSGEITDWQVALAYGDPKAEAGQLIEAARKENPEDNGPRLGLAILHHLQGEHLEAAKQARELYGRLGLPMRRQTAQLVGQEYLHAGRVEDGVDWYLRVSNPQRFQIRQMVRSLELDGGRPALVLACEKGFQPACKQPLKNRRGPPR